MAVLVGERDAEAVDFQLGDVCDRAIAGSRTAPEALVERLQFILVVHVVEAEHRHHVHNGFESLDGTAGDAPGRGIRGDEVRVIGFELLELVQQRVERFVRDFGRVVNVVALLVMPNGIAKLLDTLFRSVGH